MNFCNQMWLMCCCYLEIKALKKRLGYVEHEADDSFISDMKGAEDKSMDRMDIAMADIDLLWTMRI